MPAPDRWQDISRLYHAALAREAPERATFLAEACAGDEALREEVELLLAHDAGPASFLGAPAMDVAAHAMTEDSGQSLIGRDIGSYHILGLLGAGGMGEVYRARDTKLGREVAIKILPAEFATDPDRLARFGREARLLASLNHPNIATIHGIESGALVMELVDGPTLAERGKIAPPEALAIARQIADALEAAHERGIVHRDLKPANVKLTTGGAVKVLDFGLAKLGPGESGGPGGEHLISGTREGAILGTAAYMSPEQARGLPIDKRTDIWAFGCVLYEMLTGRRAFEGGTLSDVMARVLELEPDWSALPASTPLRVGDLLRRCLQKDSKLRLRDIGDARFELSPDAATVGPTSRGFDRRPKATVITLASVAAIGVAAVMAIGWYRSVAPVPSVPAVRFAVPPPAGGRFAGNVERTFLSLSPDGSQLAFVAGVGSNPSQVWLRPISALEARPIPGTEGAQSVFWAPDSRSFGFFAGNKLKRADVSGSAVVPICDASEGGMYGTWGEDGQILFASVVGEAVFRVSTAGGTPVPEITRDLSRDEVRVNWPWFLPDGKRFLYLSRSKDGSGRIMLAEPGKAPRPLVSAISNPQWVEPDILIFAHDGTIVGQRVDLSQARATGEPVAIAGPIDHFFSTGRAMFTASRNGVLAYHSHQDSDRLVWVDRAGQALGAIGVDGFYRSVRLSPDGQTVLFDRRYPTPAGTLDVLTFRLDRNLETRLTSDPGSEGFPVWMPGGRGVVFMADRGGAPHLFRIDIATGADDELLPPWRFQQPEDISAAGDIIFTERTARGNYDVRVLRGGARPVTSDVFTSAFDEQQPRLSPDNRAIAFSTNESGRYELYVTSFPPKGAKVSVSADGALAPRWAPDGRELFYLSADGRLMVVPVRTQPTLDVGAPMPLFALTAAARWKDFDVARDGKKFLAIVPQSRANEQPLTVVVNWTAGLASK